MVRHALLTAAVLALGVVLLRLPAGGQDRPPPPRGQPKVDRTVLPPPPPTFGGKIGSTYKDSTPDWSPALPLTAPAGAPNVVVVVLDDVGFGHLGCYGGPIQTPNLEIGRAHV